MLRREVDSGRIQSAMFSSVSLWGLCGTLVSHRALQLTRILNLVPYRPRLTCPGAARKSLTVSDGAGVGSGRHGGSRSPAVLTMLAGGFWVGTWVDVNRKMLSQANLRAREPIVHTITCLR